METNNDTKEEKVISGEAHHELKAAQPIKHTVTLPSNRALITGFMLVIVAAGGFLGGVQYQKDKKSDVVAATPRGAEQFRSDQMRGNFNGGMRFGNSFRLVGEVKSVTSSSITVTDRRTSTSKTISITSDTAIRSGQKAATASDIKVGDTVMIMLDTDNNSKASRITVGSFDGPAASTQGSSLDTQAL